MMRCITISLILVLLSVFPPGARARFMSVHGFDFTLTETLYADWHKDFEFAHTPASGPQRTGRYDYLGLKNRFNLGVRSNWLTGGIRLDTAVFIGPQDGGIPHDDFVARFDDDYVNPEKVFLRIRKKEFGLELGDVYGCLGKGMVLCIKKVDQLAADTTLRGGKAYYNSGVLGFNLLGGLSNIVNVGDRIEGKLPDPNDLVVGAEARLSPLSWLRFSTHASLVKDNEDYEQVEAAGDTRRRQVWALGGTFSIPELHGIGFFAEYDYMAQNFVAFGADEDKLAATYDESQTDGHALYAMVSFDRFIFHLLGEFKWYQGFDKTGAISKRVDNSLDVGSPSAAISDVVYYGVLPPLEDESMFYRSQDFFDVFGGRARLDVEIPPLSTILFASYADFEWTHAPEIVGTDEKDYYVRHLIGGIEQRIDKLSFVGNLSGGYRWVRHGFESSVSEVWHLDADLHFPVYGAHCVELLGRVEGHDYELGDSSDFTIARGSITYGWAPYLSASYTYEYSTQPGTGLASNHFHGGELTYRFRSGSHVKIFGGSTRGGLMCAGGQCRNFPAFKGVKGEVTLRF